MTLPALYEISETYREALERLGDMELNDQVITDTLAGLTGDLTIKSTNVAAFCLHLEAMTEAIKQAEAKMAHRRQVLANRAEGIRQYLQTCMETAGIQKIECPEFKLQIKKKPPKVVIDDETQLPAEFLRIPELPPPAPDKKRIGDKLKAGEVIPGAHLEQGTRLDIA